MSQQAYRGIKGPQIWLWKTDLFSKKWTINFQPVGPVRLASSLWSMRFYCERGIIFAPHISDDMKWIIIVESTEDWDPTILMQLHYSRRKTTAYDLRVNWLRHNLLECLHFLEINTRLLKIVFTCSPPPHSIWSYNIFRGALDSLMDKRQSIPSILRRWSASFANEK